MTAPSSCLCALSTLVSTLVFIIYWKGESVSRLDFRKNSGDGWRKLSLIQKIENRADTQPKNCFHKFGKTDSDDFEQNLCLVGGDVELCARQNLSSDGNVVYVSDVIHTSGLTLHLVMFNRTASWLEHHWHTQLCDLHSKLSWRQCTSASFSDFHSTCLGWNDFYTCFA